MASDAGTDANNGCRSWKYRGLFMDLSNDLEAEQWLGSRG
jgi:hypothetical protein